MSRGFPDSLLASALNPFPAASGQTHRPGLPRSGEAQRHPRPVRGVAKECPPMTTPQADPGLRQPFGDVGRSALDTALELYRRGLWPVALHPGQKRPIGKDWGKTRPTEDDIRETF